MDLASKSDGGTGKNVSCFFRKCIQLDEIPEELCIRISADSRYKLYVNQEFVEYGPAKGDAQIWYYDEINIAPWLRKGKNVLAVELLHYSVLAPANHSIFHSIQPGLYIEDLSEKGLDEQWKCKMHDGFQQISEEKGFAPLQILEECFGFPEVNWKSSDFDDSTWEDAVAYPYQEISRNVSPGNLFPRPISAMLKNRKKFTGVVGECCSSDKDGWNRLLSGKGELNKITARWTAKAVAQFFYSF